MRLRETLFIVVITSSKMWFAPKLLIQSLSPNILAPITLSFHNESSPWKHEVWMKFTSKHIASCLNIPVTSKDLLLDSLCWLLYLKCPGKRKLREEGCVLVYHSRAQSITVGKSWVQEDKVVGQTAPQYRRRTWWIQWIQMLSLLLLFYQHSTPAHGMVSVTIKVSFPISMITTKHLGTPRSFSLLCLDPVKVAINIVHHWQRQTACLQAL